MGPKADDSDEQRRRKRAYELEMLARRCRSDEHSDPTAWEAGPMSLDLAREVWTQYQRHVHTTETRQRKHAAARSTEPSIRASDARSTPHIVRTRHVHWWAWILLAVVVPFLLHFGLRLSDAEQPDAVLPPLEVHTFGLPASAPGAKVMVLLGGWPDTHDMWRKQADAFANEYHLVSLATPDFDRPRLRRPWGYNFTEVPIMIARALDAHLGPLRRIDVLVAHDWGALWAYYLLDNALRGRVAKLVAVDIGASARDDSILGVPGISHVGGMLWSIPYQWLCGGLFAIGAGLSPWLADALVGLAWPLVPYVGPMGGGFVWGVHAPRPQQQVKWWMGYPYYHLWRSHRLFGQSLPTPAFPAVPTLFLYGARKRVMFHSTAFEARINRTAGSRTVRYDDCGHWLMHEQPACFARDIGSFLLEP